MALLRGTLWLVGGIAVLLWVMALLAHTGSGRPHWSIRPAVRLHDQVRERLRKPTEPVPSVLLELELQRLAAHIRAVEDGNEPAKAARLAACRLAYDGVLLDLCAAAAVPVPRPDPPLSADERFEAESALVGAGHGW